MKFILSAFTVMAVAMSLSFAEDAKPAKGEGKPKMNPEEAFKKLDKDADGSVSLEEFKASPKGQKDPAKAEESFKKKDKDSNGKLTLEEFKAHGPKEGKEGKKPEAKPEEKKPEEKKADPK